MLLVLFVSGSLLTDCLIRKRRLQGGAMLHVKRKLGAIATHPEYGTSEPANPILIEESGWLSGGEER